MLLSTLVFIITLLVLVVIHEFGHFIMAKRFGIKVEEFGFGIPPRIFGKRVGETLISLNWLPFGGFVKLLGEDEVNKKIVENQRSFAYQKVGKRIVVVVAGVLMNLLLAWVLFYIVLISQNFKIIYPLVEQAVVVADVKDNFPAKGAGIQSGDRILSIDGKFVKNIDEARAIIKDKGERQLTLALSDLDKKNLRAVKLTPKKTDSGEVLIGVIFSPVPFKQYKSVNEKIFSGITYCWDLTKLTFIGLGKLINDVAGGNYQQASQQVSGPVGLAKTSNDILSLGSEATLPYLWFTGVISLTLAIFNLLPIPALDGGRLFFLLMEAAIGKRVHAEFERLVHMVGFALLLMLIFLITYSDLKKIFM